MPILPLSALPAPLFMAAKVLTIFCWLCLNCSTCLCNFLLAQVAVQTTDLEASLYFRGVQQASLNWRRKAVWCGMWHLNS